MSSCATITADSATQQVLTLEAPLSGSTGPRRQIISRAPSTSIMGRPDTTTLYSSSNTAAAANAYSNMSSPYNTMIAQQQDPTRYQHLGPSSRPGEQQVISERVVEHEVRVPRKVIREDIVERVIVVPEKVVHEEVVEDLTTVRQRVVEVARPVIQERIVEVPEIEVVQRIVEVPEVVIQEKIREVPRIEVQERIIEIPRIIEQQRIVEVPEIEYHEVPVERIVEVPEFYEQVVIKQVPVPQYVEKAYPEIVNVEVTEDVSRQVPVPIEAVTTIELKVPRLRPRYTKHDIPLYVPRFVEVAMPAELMDASAIAEAEHYARQVTLLASQSAASLCEVERLAGALKELDNHYSSMAAKAGDFIGPNVAAAWGEGRFSLDNPEALKPNFTCDDQDTMMPSQDDQVIGSAESQLSDEDDNSQDNMMLSGGASAAEPVGMTAGAAGAAAAAVAVAMATNLGDSITSGGDAATSSNPQNDSQEDIIEQADVMIVRDPRYPDKIEEPQTEFSDL